jgi:hypothetical protein
MRTLFISLLWIAIAFSIGCRSVTDERGASAMCQVHHTMMRTVTVHGTGLSLDAGGRYEEAHSSLFPNVFPTDMPKKWVTLYICDDCLKAQKEWFQAHK